MITMVVIATACENAVNNAAATNADSIAVEDVMEVTVAAAVVVFLVVEFFS